MTMNEEQMREALTALLSGDTSKMREGSGLKFEGTAIVLPKGMKLDEAIEVLKRRKVEMEQVVAVRELIPGYPLDAVIALQKAMKEKYGWTALVPTPGFFGDRPPTMVGVTINAAGDVVQVPWSRMTIPGVKGWIAPAVELDSNGRPMLLLIGEVRRGDLEEIADISARARVQAAKESIYRGKAIRISFPKFDEDHPFNPQVHVPQFLRLNGVKRSDLIFRDEVEWGVQTNIFTPIENLQKLREMGTPFRRGILAAGEYGVGKTLLANVTAKTCEENGITFIYLEKTGDIAAARAFAAQYAPAVIFAEDVDSVLAGEARDESVNEILNTIDGVEGKHDEVMIIFSTNHPEKINRALLRPGRLDAVITIEPPDAAAAQRLVRFYAKETLAASEDLTELGEKLKGHIPAAIREVVERAKLAAVPRSAGGKVTITAKDLLFSVASMARHLAMIKEKPVVPPSDIEKLGDIVGRHLATGVVRAAERGVLDTSFQSGKSAEQAQA